MFICDETSTGATDYSLESIDVRTYRNHDHDDDNDDDNFDDDDNDDDDVDDDNK